MSEELWKLFPQLIPLNEKNTELDGFITVMGEDYRIHITLDDHSTLASLRLKGSWKLQQLLETCKPLIQQRLAQSTTLCMFLQEFSHILELQIQRMNLESVSLPPPTFYSIVLKQLDGWGWDKLVYIDDSLTALHFQVDDMACRNHILQVTLPQQFPTKSPSYAADLPIPFSYSWTVKSSIQDVYQEFRAQVMQLQPFWDCMDELDENMWILEPEKPMRKDCQRRIALGTHASLQLIVNPSQPTMQPQFVFMGADRVVGPLKDTFAANISLWDTKDSLFNNLKQLLQMEFPLHGASQMEDITLDCGICYSYLLGNAIPDKACEAQFCGRLFHVSCLYEWLRMLPTKRESFGILFGECPYCNKPITCKIP